MRELTLHGARIFVWRGAIAEIGENIRAMQGTSRAFLLADRNCRRIANTVGLSLRHAGFQLSRHDLPPGETQKSLRTAARLYDALVRAKIDRASVFVTVGGGVTGDLGGFVASTYLRGVPLFHVPTTLLAQVDASIGGKTAVNLPQGKNLVGTFYHPRAVFIDPMTLTSLPEREYVCGLAEIVKAAMIRDAELFQFLDKHSAEILRRDHKALEEVLFRAAGVKVAVVAEDEKESGLRAVLNYGHTVGHGIEAAGAFRKVHHGEAVAIGMEAEARMAVETGILSPEAAAAQRKLLDSFGLPVRLSGLSEKKVRAAMSLDKKSRGGKLRFALPDAIGTSLFGVEIPEATVEAALAAVLS